MANAELYAYVKVQKQESELQRNKKGDIIEKHEIIDGKIMVNEIVQEGSIYELENGLRVTPVIGQFTNLYKVITQSQQGIFKVDDIVHISAHYFIEANKI